MTGEDWFLDADRRMDSGARLYMGWAFPALSGCEGPLATESGQFFQVPIRSSVIGTTRQAYPLRLEGDSSATLGRGTYSEAGGGAGRRTEGVFPDRRRLVGDPMRCSLFGVCCWHLPAIPVKAGCR